MKVVPSDARPSKVVVGYFDPLHAGHIRRLKQLCAPGERLTVLVADPVQPILPILARAELVAALDCVEYVLTDPGAVSVIGNLIDERAADSEHTREFTRHVLGRNMLARKAT